MKPTVSPNEIFAVITYANDCREESDENPLYTVRGGSSGGIENCKSCFLSLLVLSVPDSKYVEMIARELARVSRFLRNYFILDYYDNVPPTGTSSLPVVLE